MHKLTSCTAVIILAFSGAWPWRRISSRRGETILAPEQAAGAAGGNPEPRRHDAAVARARQSGPGHGIHPAD